MLLLMVWHQHVYTQPRQDSNDCTSLILAIGDDNDATAEALIAPTASAGALDVQVGGRGQGGGGARGAGGGADTDGCA